CVASFDVESVFTDFNQVERYCDGYLNSTEIRSVTKTSGLAYSLHQERYESKHGTGSNFRSATHSREPFIGLKQSLPSQVDVVSPFVARVMRFIATFRGSDGSDADIQIALREAIFKCGHSWQRPGPIQASLCYVRLQHRRRSLNHDS